MAGCSGLDGKCLSLDMRKYAMAMKLLVDLHPLALFCLQAQGLKILHQGGVNQGARPEDENFSHRRIRQRKPMLHEMHPHHGLQRS